MEPWDKLPGKSVTICSGLQIYPPESGGQWRTALLAKSLSEKGYKVFLYSFTGRKKDYLARQGSSESEVAKNITEYVNRNPLWGFLQWVSYRLSLPPLWLFYLSHVFVPKRLLAEIRKSETVIVDFPFLAPVWRKTSALKILNTHNVEHDLSLNCQPQVKQIERMAVSQADRVLTCSESDKRALSSLSSDPKPMHLLPNGADPTRFIPYRNKRTEIRNELKVSAQKKLILFAGSHFTPNREALEYLVKFSDENEALLDQLKIHFLVVGTVSHPIQKKHLTALGRVEKVEPYFVAADAAINPVVEGSGTNIKMYEYLAADLPIYSTSFGSRGIDAPSIRHFDRDYLAHTLESHFS